MVVATRWPLRSAALFSWDSANFALALDHIDIGAHQPHPPGYLGYVWAARVLLPLSNDPNAALVMWNIVATALAAVILIRFACDLTPDPAARIRTAVIAGLMLVTSPLLWFYGTVAEIYASEFLVTLVIAYMSWRAIRGAHDSIYWCVVALALGVVFKVSAAMLMMPLAMYAWTHVDSPRRRRSAWLLVGLLVAVGAVFLAVQPNLPTLTWQQLTASTSDTRIVGGDARPMRALNRNIRDFLVAMISAVGPVNFIALLVLAFRRPRLPASIDTRVAALWVGPWLVILLGVHIAKPGYVLPLVPLAILTLATWYAGFGRSTRVLLVTLQSVVSVAMFLWLSPPSESSSGGQKPYRSKTLLQKIVSDLQPLTLATAHTVAASDARVRQLQNLVASTCDSGGSIIIAGDTIVDWRRVMWLFPQATAINVDDRAVLFSATLKQMRIVPEAGQRFSSDCPIIWLNDDRDIPASFTPRDVTIIPGLGAVSRPGSVFITPTAVRYERGQDYTLNDRPSPF